MIAEESAQKRVVILIIGVLAAIIIFVSLWRSPFSKDEPIPVAEVETKDFEVSVNAVGELDAMKATTISSGLKEEAKIIYLIEDGSRVQQNDVLARLDAKPFQEKVDQLRFKVTEWTSLVDAQRQLYEFEKIQANREIKTAEFDHQTAILELEKAQKGDGPLELSRLEGLMLDAKKKFEEMQSYIRDLEELGKKGYSDPMEVTQAKENALKLKKDFQVAEKQFNSYQDYLLPTLIKTAQSKMERCLMIADEAKKASGFKIGKAMADLNRIQQELKDYEEIYKTAQSELEKTTTLAPQPGLVVLKESFREGEMRKPRVGDIVLQNQPILFLPDVSFMMAKTLIREVDLNKIEVGKPVLIQVDAYPDKTFRGKVDIIGVLAERRPELPQGEKYFKVNISLIESDQNLRPGMTCRIKIEAQKLHGNTLTIPVHAAFEIGGKKYCYIVHPYGFEQREIVLGIQNDELVQVLKGVQEREKISLIQPPAEKVNKTTLLNPPAKK